MPTRRQFIEHAAALGVVATASVPAFSASDRSTLPTTETTDLCGQWQFLPDAKDVGVTQKWFAPEVPTERWTAVNVPHTWQIEPALADYRGVAWYRRQFEAPESWRNSAVRIHFEAVFHTATVWVNGQLVGDHVRKGYTEFTLDITSRLAFGARNVVVVRVDSAFNEHMLPRMDSSDWANDGGIFRPVQLLVTPKTYIERVRVDAVPDFARKEATLRITGYCRNTSSRNWTGRASVQVVDDETGLPAAARVPVTNLSIQAGAIQELAIEATLPQPKLWHFDHPNLYRLVLHIANEDSTHQIETNFGVRKLEVKDGRFVLNGQNVQLVGVERMAGSHPDFGMAEPATWIAHDHEDLQRLNCIFTRVHWPQDKRVLDYCDRHGILMQSEVPAWGPATFQGTGNEPDPAIMENGLEQLREMIAQCGNHPSIVIWGLCNEIDGQNPPAYAFAKRMLAEAKKLDSSRLCSYASNSLGKNPQRDVAGLMDIIEANEYFGTWAPGNAESLARHLDELHATFPGKPIVISEYGYCACTEDRPEGDEHRIRILRTHNEVLRAREFIGGTIFFCYNDYRTHVGDRGTGVLQQRVHGVVDVFGTRKPSYEVLREECSPVESITVDNDLNSFRLRVRNRQSLPAYTLAGYKLRGTFYGQGRVPVERLETTLPELAPGAEAKAELTFREKSAPLWVTFEVLRPSGVSAFSVDWKP